MVVASCFFIVARSVSLYGFFFFQAEDGIRDGRVTGVQTCALPISYPGVHSGEILRARRELGESQAYVDFALYGGGGASEEGIRSMAAEGAIAYKIFLHSAPPGREVEFEGLTAVDTASLYRAFERIAPIGLPCAVHSEDDDLIEARTAELRARGEVGPGAHQESRPDFVEALAV